jgi:hypothetical protein
MAMCTVGLQASSLGAADPSSDDLLAVSANGDLMSIVPAHTSVTLTGVELGGLIGLGISASLEFATNSRFHPFLDATAGLSGIRYGIGVIALTEPRKRWLSFASDEHPQDYPVNAGLGVRAVLVDRWNDGTHRTEAEYGESRDKQTYLGLESMAVVAGLSLTPGVYRDTRTHQSRFALAYGIGF